MATAQAKQKRVESKPPPPPRWPADKIVQMKLDAIRGSEGNPRVHTTGQVNQIIDAIKEFGWTVPIVIDEKGEIIAGHGRAMAARRMGLKTVPVVVAEGWSREQRLAYRIWDNQSTLLSEWNPELLRVDLTELKLKDFDLALTGFDDAHLVSFMAFGGPVNPEEEWAGMPGFNQNKEIFRTLIVHFRNQDDVDAFAAHNSFNVTETTRYIWYGGEQKVSLKHHIVKSKK